MVFGIKVTVLPELSGSAAKEYAGGNSKSGCSSGGHGFCGF
jgi:hypothetical protein